jgi:multiple sugar transport system ATP-binding protein
VNRFVAGFLGSPAMNFVHARMQAHAGHAYAVAGDIRLKLPEGVDFAENRPVVYGIRPEDIAVNGADGPSITVEVVEPTGTGVQVFGRLAEGEFCVVVNGRPAVHPGDRIAIRPDLSRVRLFDPEDGRAL